MGSNNPSESEAGQASVHERLKLMAMTYQFRPGERINEIELSAKLGVSRTPVREALAMLQLQGMVTIVPQKGTYVFMPTERDLVDLCEFRIVIESKAIYFAMARDRDATLAALKAAVAEMDATRERHDPVAYSRADTAFHEAFLRHCGNRYLQESYALAAGPIATLRNQLSAPLAGVQDRSYVQHKQMLEAFEKGDVMALDAILTAHILGTRESYVRALGEGLIGTPERRQPTRGQAPGAP